MAEPIGVRIPIRLGNTGFFEQTLTSIDEAKSNMYNLLLTQKGERYMQPEFGTRIYSKLFEQITTSIKDEIETDITDAVGMWLPYVELMKVDVDISDDNIDANRFDVRIEFGLKRDLNQYEEIQIIFAT